MFPLSLFSPTFLQYSACKTGARKYYLMDNYESCNFIGIFLFVINSHLTQFTVHSSSKQSSVFRMVILLRIIHVLTQTTTSDKVRVRYYSLGMYLYLEYIY